MALEIVTDHHRAEMAEKGYTVVRDLFTSAELEDLTAAIDIYSSTLARHTDGGQTGSADEITFTPFLAENEPAIMAFVQRPEFVSLSTCFLGADTDFYWNQAVYKEGHGTKPFTWHQDDGYTAVSPSPYLTVWIPLTDASVENGCIWALPGSHRNGLAPHIQTEIGLECHSLSDPDQGVPVPVKAGDVAVFWSLTMHKSGVNTSAEMRKSYIVQYSAAGLRNAETGGLIEHVVPVARSGRSVNKPA